MTRTLQATQHAYRAGYIMVKKSKKPKHEKPSSIRTLAKNVAETRYFRQEPWREHWMNAITAHPLEYNAYGRLKALLSGPDPVNGAQARHPSMDEHTLFYDLLRDLKFPVTAQVVGGLDRIIGAVCLYAHCDIGTSPPLDRWPPSYAQDNWPPRPEDEIDTQFIVNSIFIARAYSMRYGYCWEAWQALRDGLGLYGEENSDSMRIGSCAQLLAAGQQLRDWCAGRGEIPKDDRFEMDPNNHEWERPVEWWLYKPKEPLGKQAFNEIVDALDTQSTVTQNEWVKAVLAVSNSGSPSDRKRC